MNKNLVGFFTVLLIVVSLFQLSFTYFVNQHENKQEQLAQAWLESTYPLASVKYTDDTKQQKLYQDTLDLYKKNYYNQLIDKTRNEVITYGLQGEITYQKAKESELNLGLDLQGGISVTLEIKFEEFISSLANNPKDVVLVQSLKNAVQKRYETNQDFIDLFVAEYKKLNPNGSLLSIINLNKIGKLPNQPTETDIINVLKTNATLAMDNTFNILSKRIDQFGVAQPSINLDKDRGIITVELAGVSNLDRVRKYLQSSANLEFFEVLRINEIVNSLIAADKFMAEKLKVNVPKKETTNATNNPSTAQDDGLGALLQNNNNQDDTLSSLNGSSANNPILSLLIQAQDQNAPEIGYTTESNKATLERYLNESSTLFPKNARMVFGLPITTDNETIYPIYALRTNAQNKASVGGKHIVDASQDFDPLNPGRVVVNMAMNIEGTRRWRDLTQKNINKPVAVVLDNVVYTAPTVNGVISDGKSQISGNFSIEEGQDLAKILKSGKLPVSASIVQEQVVGPTLGLETVKKGGLSFLISFVVIFILMLVYYNTGGWIANIALLLNLLFTIGILSSLGATLTAAGIAGLILTIGMAVDSNVIIFERIKEELFTGANMSESIRKGYFRSLAPVLDSHLTTLLTAIILYSFGLGPVKGFATTQIIGILLSLFCGILFSRLLSDWLVKRNKNKEIKFFTPISKNLFKKASFKFIENRKYAYILSLFVLAGGIFALVNGFDQGVEFAGGRSYTVQFDEVINPNDLRPTLQNALEGENPILKTLGSGNTVNITTSYLINQNDLTTDSTVLHHVFDGVKTKFAKDLSFEDFKQDYLIGSTKVLPTISEDLKTGSQLATFWSLLLIAIYILIRFRNWQYALGTIVALVHDVLVMLIVFSFFRNIVPFSLEIDQHFIAAILTVIGFSMNDTIIVFDRIREYRKLFPSDAESVVINKAINNTLSRTIMTSLTVLLTVLILFLVGGDVTKGFAFALLIGIGTGTYSSIFVAAPILIDLKKKAKGTKAK